MYKQNNCNLSRSALPTTLQNKSCFYIWASVTQRQIMQDKNLELIQILLLPSFQVMTKTRI